MDKVWLIWLIMAAIFFIAEIFTAGFFLFWFSMGALAAAILALVGVKATGQWIAFVLVSCVLLAISRRFAEKVSKKQPEGIGADRAIGKVGVVKEEINPSRGTGSAEVERELWRAESSQGEVILKGSKIKVIRVEGTHLVVEKEGE
jgi:membrane protein implicated in regulation of membrane protease activity